MWRFHKIELILLTMQTYKNFKQSETNPLVPLALFLPHHQPKCTKSTYYYIKLGTVS